MKASLKDIHVFVAYWLIAFAFYHKTASSGFATDTIGWFLIYEATGWKGIFHVFDDRSLHFIYHLLGFSLWNIFGFNGFAYMTLFVTLHTIAAFQSFQLFSRL